MNSNSVLKVQRLKTFFYTERGVVRAVDGVDFQLNSGETLGIVGESGCGKSVTALSILGLIPRPPGKIVGGDILFKSQNLLTLPIEKMRRIRGNDIAMIFQEPMTSLNPVLSIGRQISEAVRLHEGVGRGEALRKTVDMLHLVGIPSPEKRVRDYPHQFSGGMRQRVMIAMALSCNPKILIADEPTTALDVTIQTQILRLISDLQKKLGMAVILITHDLGIVAQTAKRIIVMYMGKIVEEADVHQLFAEPRHPYTRGLFNSLPNFYKDIVRKEHLEEIPGVVGSLVNPPSGCYFSPRCRYTRDICRQDVPALNEVQPGHSVRCWLVEKGGIH
ncbi:ABC transporter ATP-binding protein [bacterium]|nr:ABC transporter ATP-binding protein [bacterium]